MNCVDVTASLEQILLQRDHGSISLGGYEFQLLYSLNRFLDLLGDSSPITSIRFEGIEDIDIQCVESKTYIQVKSSRNKKGWGWLNSEKIIDKFAEVYLLDSNAKFLIVTNFQYSGDLKLFHQISQDSNMALPPRLSERFDAIQERCNISCKEMQALIRAVHFEITDQTKLIDSIQQKIVTCLDVDTGNEDLYFLALFTKVLEFAVNRSKCYEENLRKIQLDIQDWISAGPENLAVTNGWIEPLTFQLEPDGNVLDYYEGKGARPVHILAGVDVERPEWIDEIHKSLSAMAVCVIRSSSGQGKSTLLYRYAHNYFNQHTTFVLNTLQNFDEIAPLKRFLESRLKLGLPVLVLVNDLNERVKLWHELARELAGHPISFLIVSREENWYRYAGNLHNLQWKTVKPELSIQEAKDIYRQFEKKGRIANNVKSAAWAYDKVATEKLLIEFVFLITHGQMLSERLEDQVRTIYSLQEDSAKLHILRLVCLAQYFDVRIPLQSLYSRVQFQSDPQQAVQSLADEYLEVIENRYLEGLHYVRSEHLVKILHQGFPINTTTTELFDLVSDGDLAVLARSAFSSMDRWAHAEPLLNKLHDRTAGRVALSLEVWRSLFRADEHRYILRNRDTIDNFKRTFGTAELSTFFVNGTMPLPSGLDVVEEIRELFSDELLERKLDLMRAQIQRMPDRREEEQFARVYVTKALRRFAANDLSENLSAVSSLRTWSQMYDESIEILSALVNSGSWRDHVFAKPIDEFADFMHLLYRDFPGAYREFIDENWLKTVNHFRNETETLQVIVQGDNIHIEFVVDESRDIHDDQTLSRLTSLMKLLPHYETYTSQGLYPVTPIGRLSVDDSKKNLTEQSLNKDIAEINSMYIVELEVFVNPDSMYDWLVHWHKFRATLSTFAAALAKRFGDVLEKKATVDLQPLVDELSPLLDETPGIPARYKEVFEQQIKLLRAVKCLKDWKGWAKNFVNMSMKINYADRSSESTRLLRHNLSEVCGRLKQMQDAYQTILDSGVSHFQSSIKVEDEEKNYRYLYDLLHYYVSLPESRTVPRGARVKAMVSAWRKSQWREVNTRLKEAFQSAADNGLRVHLPYCYLEELPAKSLCFAVEIVDATQIHGHLDVVVAYLHTAAVAYDYVYILPVINCRPSQSIAYQIHSETVRKIATGEQLGDEIAIWPVETPTGFFKIVNGIDRDVLLEWQYYLGAQSILYRLHGLRNEVAYVSQRVEDELSDWRTQLFTGIEQRLAATVDDAKQLIESSSRFRVQIATEEWVTMWQYFADCVENKKKSVFDVAGFDPVPPDDDENLMHLYGSYLNCEHLRSDH